MRLHANARLTPAGRLLLCQRVCDQGRTLGQAAEAAGVSLPTARRWLSRYRAEGADGLVDRSSRPSRSPRRTAPERERAVVGLRRTGMTAAEIALCLGMSARTCSRIVRRAGLGRLRSLEPAEPVVRYERERPGELLHVDVKKLGRIDGAGHRVSGRRSSIKRRTGWEYVHCAVDDATRLAYCESHPDERQETACGFLRRAVRWFSLQGIRIERVLTDNGSAYRSHHWRRRCARLGISPRRTRAYRPRTNGKVERFIQTLTRRWAHGCVYGSSAERLAALPEWLRFYNHVRPHRSLKLQTPAKRLAALLENNVVADHS